MERPVRFRERQEILLTRSYGHCPCPSRGDLHQPNRCPVFLPGFRQTRQIPTTRPVYCIFIPGNGNGKRGIIGMTRRIGWSVHPMSRHAPVWMSWLMGGSVASFYLIGFFQRVAPAVMVDELMREFQIGGGLLGKLSATHFYSYTVMQIPSGLLADGIGPRRLSAAAALLAAVGTLMFWPADHLGMAYV